MEFFSFNNREIAIAFWIVAGLLLLTWKASAWGALKALLAAACARPIRIYLLVLCLYVAGCVMLLADLGLWGVDNVKTTVYWVFGFAVIAPLQCEKIEAEGEKQFFKKAMKDAAGITAIVAFIASTQTFSLFVEILLIGAILLFTMLAAFSEKREDARVVARVSNGALIFLGAVVLAFALYQISKDFFGFTTFSNARELLTQILLTFLFLPFVYGMHVFLIYERAFLRIGFAIKNPVVKSYARKRLVSEIGLDLDGVKKWLRHIGLFSPKSEAEVAASIAEIKTVRRRERDPYRVPPLVGWGPNLAREFLLEEGLKVNDYHRSHDTWRASSNCMECSSVLLPSNIGYYLEGEEYAVLKLRLVLNANEHGDDEQAKAMFEGLASLLASRALKRYGMKDQKFSLEAGKDPAIIHGKKISLFKREFPSGIGYELELVIEVDSTEISRT